MGMTQMGQRLQDLAKMLQNTYEIGFCHPISQPAVETLKFDSPLDAPLPNGCVLINDSNQEFGDHSGKPQ